MALSAGLVGHSAIVASMPAPTCPVDATNTAPWPTHPAGIVTRFGDDCCEAFAASGGYSCAGNGSPSLATPNILLVVADDQTYCEYGFMAGVCDAGPLEGRDCRSDVDCWNGVGGGACVARRSGTSPDAPLRLAELSCRYRQPPGRTRNRLGPSAVAGVGKLPCREGDQPDAAASQGGDNRSFPYQISNFPCAATHPAGQPPRFPVPLTPHLDRLATQGAVFTRAYVGGNACKSSRSVMVFGKAHRHMEELEPDEVGNASLATWLYGDSDHRLDDGETPAYWPFVLGKLDSAALGFQGGETQAKPALARYACEDSSGYRRSPHCAEVAAVSAGDPHRLWVPAEILGTRYGTGPALDLIEGIGFEDRQVIVWLNGSGERTGCAGCGHEGVSGVCDPACGPVVQRPFFLWWAPNMPHKRGNGRPFRGLYADHDRSVQKHFARVTQLDQTIGALVEDLKRHCICDAAGKPASLYANTVMIVVSDHGFFMPNAKANDLENTHRTVMIVSEPGHRQPSATTATTLPPRVYDEELVHMIDLFRTVLGYAGIAFGGAAGGDPVEPGDATEYRFGRNLLPWIRGTTTAPIRQLLYNQDAAKLTDKIVRGDGQRRYLVTRPGLIGICPDPDQPDGIARSAPVPDVRFPNAQTPVPPRPHARLCSLVGGDDCAHGSCQPLGRCVNDPERSCTPGPAGTDACAAGLCVDGTCAWDPRGSIADRASPDPDLAPLDLPSASCAEDADCVPRDVLLCRPPMLKVEAKPDGDDPNAGIVDSAWDLRWDPDQRIDLLKYAPDYLGASNTPTSLRARFKACLDYYWTLDLDAPQGSDGFREWVETAACQPEWREPCLDYPDCAP